MRNSVAVNLKRFEARLFHQDQIASQQSLLIAQLRDRVEALEKAPAPVKRTGLCKKCRASLDDAK